MVPKTYALIRQCVEDGTTRELSKHLPEEFSEIRQQELTEAIADAVMLEISEIFNFSNEELGVNET